VAGGALRFASRTLHLSPIFQEKVHMNYAENILPEFDQEMANTRKVLECIPEEKFD